MRPIGHIGQRRHPACGFPAASAASECPPPHARRRKKGKDGSFAKTLVALAGPEFESVAGSLTRTYPKTHFSAGASLVGEHGFHGFGIASKQLLPFA